MVEDGKYNHRTDAPVAAVFASLPKNAGGAVWVAAIFRWHANGVAAALRDVQGGVQPDAKVTPQTAAPKALEPVLVPGPGRRRSRWASMGVFAATLACDRHLRHRRPQREPLPREGQLGTRMALGARQALVVSVAGRV